MLQRNLTLVLHWWCNPLRTIASVVRVWWMLILVVIKLQDCVSVIQVLKENQFFKADFL